MCDTSDRPSSKPSLVVSDADHLRLSLRGRIVQAEIEHWSLTTLREKLVKIEAKVTRHATYVTFQLAEVAVPRRSFAAILDRIAQLAIPPPCVAGGHG